MQTKVSLPPVVAIPLLISLLASFPASAQEQPQVTSPEPPRQMTSVEPPPPSSCTAPAGLARLELGASRLGQRIALKQPITIVAIGSSSTAGAGASSSAASYPSRLEAELTALFPHLTIRVLNRGVNGEEANEMLARFDTAVIAEQPDLVLWQVGTNTVLRDHALTPVGLMIHDGIARLKAAGADVVLINPQYAPKVLAKPDVASMLALISSTAKGENVALFDRYAVMRNWREGENIPFEAFLSPDGIHMNDWSYGCVAKLLAASLFEAATRAPTVARAQAFTNAVAP